MTVETIRTRRRRAETEEEASGQRYRSAYVGGPDPAMRRPETRRSSVVPRASAPPSLYQLVAHRLSFGPSPGLWADWIASGGNADQRLNNWIDAQLWPAGIDDSAFDSRLAAAGFTTLNKDHGQLWWDHVENNQSRYLPAEEVELSTLMRMAYSRKQLFEVLVDFWHNHFNAFGWDYWSAPVWVSYDRTIRWNLLGNFRLFLQAIAQHSAMLYYLDQYTSSRSGPNENFARELFELHTLGAENYYGVIRQDQVPKDGQGRPLGYVDDDVFEATYALTGWTLDFDTGWFDFREDWHDLGQKRVLGVDIPSGGAVNDGYEVLNILCSHPGTARHIARKLCQRLVSDDPPESLVQKAANVFHQNWHPASPNGPVQLTLVYQTILKSAEFKSIWGEKAKRPLELVIGALRATATEIDFRKGADDVDSFLWRLDDTGQPLFGWRSPDGYPDDRAAWESTGPRVMTWRLISWLTDIKFPSPYNNVPRMNLAVQTPGGTNTAGALVDFWVDRILKRPIDPDDRQELIDLLGFGSANTLVNLADQDDDERLRATVGVILNSPYFLER